jgi:hypothetical protein
MIEQKDVPFLQTIFSGLNDTKQVYQYTCVYLVLKCTHTGFGPTVSEIELDMVVAWKVDSNEILSITVLIRPEGTAA